MEEYTVVLRGESPLLMHNDDIDWADQMTAWKDDPNNKHKTKAGDDRTPPWRWIGYLYHDGGRVVIPTDNLASAIMQGATQIILKGNKTYKEASRASLLLPEDSWPLLVNGKQVSWDEIRPLQDQDLTFSDHVDWVKALGFLLSVKRARVGQSKHIRVRPRFDDWQIQGLVQVDEEVINADTLKAIFKYAGKKGLCDWRPSSPKSPGPWGRFVIEHIKKNKKT